MGNNGTLLTPSHAARQLGISAAWVIKLFDQQKLAGTRDSSGRRLLTPESVARLAQERRDRQQDVSKG